MAKIDKSQFSKRQWKLIRDKRRKEKEKQQEQEPALVQTEFEPNKKIYVLCLKHGTKYSSDYVNKLYSMVKRNLTLNFEMVCLTDNSNGIHPDIIIKDLPKTLKGWWCKPYMFADEIGLNGTILYLDLDVVISGNLDKLFTFSPGSWCIIRDFTRSMRPQWEKYNSSVIRFDTGTLNHLWKNFAKNPNLHTRKFHGDQDYIYDEDRSATLWPDSWILSWKWEIRKSREFVPGGTKGNRKLRHIENVVPPSDCCITVFHGDPNPDNCDDPWVVENWQ